MNRIMLSEEVRVWKDQINKNPRRLACIDCNRNCFTFCEDDICMICGGKLMKMETK